MDFATVIDIAFTALFGFTIVSDLFWIGQVVRHQRAQEGWVDDIGWILVGTAAAAFFITGLWTGNIVVTLIALLLILGTRRGRMPAIQRALDAREQRRTDKALLDAAADAETGEPVDPDQTPNDREDAPR